ncbi:uncharacterized protein LOC136036317 [Artemia franciscana]|uniref:Uncharacterized protein n=1 Tax=Artemia franciscana TaxID=6661 RepID=A0AA88L103_ARTSF|nr:hypothetical protein QYM36_009784 [Artemia franciscana]
MEKSSSEKGPVKSRNVEKKDKKVAEKSRKGKDVGDKQAQEPLKPSKQKRQQIVVDEEIQQPKRVRQKRTRLRKLKPLDILADEAKRIREMIAMLERQKLALKVWNEQLQAQQRLFTNTPGGSSQTRESVSDQVEQTKKVKVDLQVRRMGYEEEEETSEEESEDEENLEDLCRLSLP